MFNCDWNGSHLGPLAHESSLSVFWRFAWRNALDANTMQSIVTKSGFDLYGNSLLSFSWLQAHLLPGRSPLRREVRALQILSKVENVFFSKNLRICPLCLECGYHSFWHQLKDLIWCPLHNCGMLRDCVSCGAPLGVYGFTKASMQWRYRCEQCGESMCGADVTLEKHMDFRDSVQNIESVFGPLSDYLERSAVQIEVLRKIGASHLQLKRYEAWCVPERFYRTIAFSNIPLRPICLGRAPEALTSISWCITMREGWGTLSENGRKISLMRRRRAGGAYISTVHLLRKWLLASLSGDSPLRQKKIDRSKQQIDVRDWSDELLAYHLMRCVFEPTYRESISEQFSVKGLQQRFFADPQFNTVDGREPRQAWRSLFLGLFAILFWMIRRSRKSGVLTLDNLRASVLDMVPMCESSNMENQLRGTVFFPTIPNLPLSLFKAHC